MSEVRSALGLTIDTLHEAARLMRERAGDATQGVWSSDDYGSVVSGMTAPPADDRLSSYCFESSVAEADDSEGADIAEANGKHIASWHPVVALAVADWLDRTARNLPVGDNGGPAVLPGSTYEAAVAVARAYLGVSA